MKTRKNAFITGACGGIGRALVSAFSSSGYRVIASDQFDKGPSLGESEYIKIDLDLYASDEGHAVKVNRLIDSLIGGSGLSVLINNAATQILGNIDEISRDQWRKSFNVNVNAPFFLTQVQLAHLKKGKGNVINVSSIHARLTKQGFSAYSTTKAALSGLTRAMAVEIGSKIRVNAIEIAAIDTEMLRSGFVNSIEKYSKLKSCHPVGEIGTPEEVARCALYMAADSSAFLNGASISLDGGVSASLNESVLNNPF